MSPSEQAFFSPLPSSGNGIDFEGFHIDNIALQIEQLTFTYPGEYQTAVAFRGRILVNSELVPTNSLAIDRRLQPPEGVRPAAVASAFGAGQPWVKLSHAHPSRRSWLLE
jgi:hypothetical protein